MKVFLNKREVFDFDETKYHEISLQTMNKMVSNSFNENNNKRSYTEILYFKDLNEYNDFYLRDISSRHKRRCFISPEGEIFMLKEIINW